MSPSNVKKGIAAAFGLQVLKIPSKTALFQPFFPAEQLTNISVCDFFAFYCSLFYCYLTVASLRAAMWVKQSTLAMRKNLQSYH
jgi:hypothetical protein